MFSRKKYLLRLKRQRSEAQNRPTSGILLDRNEKFVSFSKKINKKLWKKLSNIKLGLYPNLENFYIKLSKWLKIEKEQVFITEGVSGAIKSLIETLTMPGKHNVIFPFPTFAMYPIYSKMFNIKFKKIGYKKNYKLDLKDLKKKIDKKTAIVFIPNPNIPIEGILKMNELVDIAKKCKSTKTFLVIDEVYYPYSNISAIKLIKKFSNVLIMRSFSKSFGLAGIRLGFIIGNKKVIDYVSKTRTGYESNSVSIEIASFFLDNFSEIKNYQKDVKRSLIYLKQKLSQNNIENTGGLNSNYLYINFKNIKKKKYIIEQLRRKSIFVRGNWPKPFDTGILVSGAPLTIIKKFYNTFLKAYKKIENI